MKTRTTFIFAALTFLISAATSYILTTNKPVNVRMDAAGGYTYGDAATYYNGISSTATGKDLLGALNSLNSSRKKANVGYSNMPTQYKYTDYDPEYASVDNNGIRYGERLLSFYSGTSNTYIGGDMNREHVWPDSRGGSKVEGDIHMPRPTVKAENGSRGNSFYVEGMKHSSNGWDPAMESFGKEDYRGDLARIIFYCAIADTSLTLIDETKDDKTNKTMGKLSDMIKWHLKYPVADREKNRNEGAEYLQGNRNPFIDHPEYVCRIWGNTNETTKSLCAKDPYAKPAPTQITLSETSITIKLEQTKTLSIKSVTPTDANMDVNWTTSNASIVSVSTDGVIEGKGLGKATITATSISDSTVKATCEVTVEEPEPISLQDITVTPAKIDTFTGKTTQISVILSPNYVYPKATIAYSTSNSKIATVNQEGQVKGISAGETEIVITATQNGNGIVKKVAVKVEQSTEPTYELVTSVDSLETGDKVVLATSLEEHANGVTGAADNKNAAISETKDSWLKYEVTVNSSGFKLYDSTAKQFIKTPTSNAFEYDSDGGVCSVDGDGHLKCNNRYLCKNTSYIRFYTTMSNYVPFFVYKFNDGSTPIDEEPTLDSIRVSDYTTTCNVGDEYEFDGKVVAIYSDGSSKEITNYTVSDVDTSNAGKVTVIITYVEGGITKTASFALNIKEEIVPVTLTSIELKDYTTTCNVGDEYEFDGTVIAHYSDGSSKEITNYTVSEVDSSIVGDTEVTISYMEGGITKTASYTITISEVKVVPVKIELSNYSTEIYVNDKFFYDGDVLVYFSDGSTNDNVSLIITDPFTNEPGEVTITVTYRNNGVEVSASYILTIKERPVPILSSIRILDQTTSIKVGDRYAFDGKVIAFYDDGSSKEITNYTVSDVNTSSVGEVIVTITYVEGDITETASFTLYIREEIVPVTLISIELRDYSTEIEKGSEYVFDGKVIAFYDDGTSKEVDNYIVSEVNTEKVGIVTVTITYSEGNMQETVSFALNVKEKEEVIPGVELVSIEIKDYSTTIKLGEKYTFDGTVIAHYSDGSSKEVTNISVVVEDYSSAGRYNVSISYKEGETTVSQSFFITVEEKTSGGMSYKCGGSIEATSIILSSISLFGVALIFLKKKRV